MRSAFFPRFGLGLSAAITLWLAFPLSSYGDNEKKQPPHWFLGPFTRADEANPLITPTSSTLFYCPISQGMIAWESDHTFNPAAVVHENEIYLFYRAEDASGQGIGFHTSRLGLAKSSDGLHFERMPVPIFFPDNDEEKAQEWPGGCEDPRIIQKEDGTFVMYYTQWNRSMALLAVATSSDLVHWKKHGYIFEEALQGHFGKRWSKSGSVVTRRVGEQLIATKLQGKYWMFWGEGNIFLAQSEDLIHWDPLVDESGELIAALEPQSGLFDSELVEPGPPALLTPGGVLLLYNGKNSPLVGDPNLTPNAYSAGQALFSLDDLTHLLKRSKRPFLKPRRAFERQGQYKGGTVFIEALVPFHGKWFLYYGAADSSIGVTIADL